MQDITFFQAEEGLVFLHTFLKKKFTVSFTLDQLEEQLDPGLFFRVNRQLMVNIHAIQEVQPYFNGRLHLTLKPGTDKESFVSGGRASAFKQWLDS